MKNVIVTGTTDVRVEYVIPVEVYDEPLRVVYTELKGQYVVYMVVMSVTVIYES